MIELAFVVCLNTAPTTCENRALQYTELTANACLMGAQPELARWVGEHPGWQIQRWTCREINSDLEI